MRPIEALDVLRLLQAAAATSQRGSVWIGLDEFAVLSMLSEAATNVNWMLLEQFLSDQGLRRQRELTRASRLTTMAGALVVLVIHFVGDRSRAQLVYAEFGALRLVAVFLGEEVVFVRDAHVVACPVVALGAFRLTGTSIHVVRRFLGPSGNDRGGMTSAS